MNTVKQALMGLVILMSAQASFAEHASQSYEGKPIDFRLPRPERQAQDEVYGVMTFKGRLSDRACEEFREATPVCGWFSEFKCSECSGIRRETYLYIYKK